MNDKSEKYEIFLDLDRDRIKFILLETYSTCKDTLETDFLITAEEFTSKINPYLDSNRVSIPVSLTLPSRKYPELTIEINLRKKSVIARMHNKNTRIHLNRYLTKL